VPQFQKFTAPGRLHDGEMKNPGRFLTWRGFFGKKKGVATEPIG
jgi:hypothetical protein